MTRVNLQTMEKPVHDSNGQHLDIVNVWETLQGEGPFTGHPATFIRLAGCNLTCHGCDTDYTSNRASVHIENILESVKQYRHKLVVLTGGEPFRQNITNLVTLLASERYNIQIETNGTLSLPGELSFPYGLTYIVTSPKTPKISKVIASFTSCFKYVIQSGFTCPNDGLPTMVLDEPIYPARPPHKGIPIYVQPMDNYYTNENVQECVRVAMKYGYIMSLQTHKLLGLE